MSSAGTTTVTRGFQFKHGDKPLEGYTIQRAAGRGGFGEVYYAVSDSGREVALKLVLTYEQIELRGISHCMNLKSPHLITIFDVKYGQDGRPWVIMEFVSGPSLRDLIDAAPSGLGVQKSAFFLREIAKGLTYLHECGIVHRDLKPGNIFYENGYVKIGDYGLSKAMSTSQYSGQTVTVGTVHYMAPEIGQGRYDKSIDIYALGTLLFEMLTGQVPFFGASPSEVLMKHLTTQADVSGIEEPFATVIRKAMAKDPAERYQSVQEMVEAVFGAEHVRNSVSHFTPESLTMVAGQVARKLPGNSSFAPSSGAASPAAGSPNPANPWDRFGRNVQKSVDLLNNGIATHVNRVVTDKLDRAARRFDAKRQRIERKFGRKWNRHARRSVNWQPPRSAVTDDPVSAGQRWALAAVAMGLVSVGVGVAGHEHGPAILTVIFALTAILGAVQGASMGMRWLLPGLPAEPKLLRRLAVGGCAAAFAVIMSLGLAIAGNQTHSWLAMIICLLSIEWEKRTAPDREARVNLGNVIKALIWGVIIGSVTEGSAWLVGGIMAGASLALEIISPWSASLSQQKQNKSAPLSPGIIPPVPTPPMPPAKPAPMMQQQQMGPGGMQQSQSMPERGFVNPMVPPAPPVIAPPISFARPVGRGVRALWLIFSVILTTIGLCLWGTLLAGGVGQDDERAMFLGFGALTTVLGIFCLRRSLGGSATGKWAYFFRPVLQILCIGTMIISLSMITIGNINSSDVPGAIFAIVFPAVVFTVITFFAGRGGTMFQTSMASSPAAVALSPAVDEGFSVAGLISGTGRLAVSVFGSAILGISVLIAVAVAADIPGLLNSHLMDPQFHREIERNFGRSDWPRLVRGLGMIASFVLAVMALAIHMRVRRRYGAIHMLRAIAAVVLMFMAVSMLGQALPSWSNIQATSNGWEFVDQYFSHIIDNHRLFGLAVPAGAGVILWFWPAGRNRVPAFAVAQQEMAR